MAGTTVPLGFPYPTGTDRVMDGDNAIQALAEAIDDFFVGASAVVPVDANMAMIGGGCFVYRRGRMATFECEMWNKISWDRNWTMAAIPVGFRPPQRFLFTATPAINSTNNYLMEVRPDGGVYCSLNLPSPNTELYGSVTYPIA